MTLPSSATIAITSTSSDGHGTVVVHGSASPGARVTVDGRTVAPGADGSWSVTLSLAPGTSATITAVATSADGASRSSTTVVVSG